MSLLLDALRQAEKNKSQAAGSVQMGADSVDPLLEENMLGAVDSLSLTIPDTLVDTPDEWVKIDLIPFADLTFPAVDNDVQHFQADSTGVPDIDFVAFSNQDAGMSMADDGLSKTDAVDLENSAVAETLSLPTTISTENDVSARPSHEIEVAANCSDRIEVVMSQTSVREQRASIKTPVPDPPRPSEQASRHLAANVLLAAQKPGISTKHVILSGVLVGTIAAVGYWLTLPATGGYAAHTPAIQPADPETAPSVAAADGGNRADVAIVTTDENKGAQQQVPTLTDTPVVASPAVTVAANEINYPTPTAADNVKPLPKASDGQHTETEDFFIESPEPIVIKVHRQAPHAEIYLNQAYQHYQNQDYIAADRYYRQVLTATPNNIDALLGMAAVAEQLGDKASAETYYQKVQALDNGNVYASHALIRLQQIRFPAEKESNYQSLLEKFPDAAQTHAALGDLYAEQERWSEAQQAYFNAVAKAPDNAEYYYNLAVCLDHLNKGALARRYYQQALQLVKDSPASFDTTSVYLRLQQLPGLNP